MFFHAVMDDLAYVIKQSKFVVRLRWWHTNVRWYRGCIRSEFKKQL